MKSQIRGSLLKHLIVYLSGAMLGWTDEECRDWREFAKLHLRCLTLEAEGKYVNMVVWKGSSD